MENNHDPLCPIVDPAYEMKTRSCECALILRVRNNIALQTKAEADRFRQAAANPPTKKARRRWLASANALEKWAAHISR